MKALGKPRAFSIKRRKPLYNAAAFPLSITNYRRTRYSGTVAAPT